MRIQGTMKTVPMPMPDMTWKVALNYKSRVSISVRDLEARRPGVKDSLQLGS